MPSAEDIHQNLIETAASYLALGWSVVPLWGDARPEQAKVPAVAWTLFQRRRASEQDAARWFCGTPYRGLGIVTGAISQLVVLDFDDPALAERFAVQYPELTETRTILTRRGHHLYFRVPAYLRLPSRKLAGVDLLSDGCYVVAPPTVIDGHTYTVERGGLPKMLAPDGVLALNAFLDRMAVERAKSPSRLTVAEPTVKTQEGAFSGEEKAFLSTSPVDLLQDASFLTAEALVTLYRGLSRQSGRNVALFKAACLARDHGWKAEAVVAVLAPVHARQVAREPKQQEKPQARHREAERTIRSAFSRLPRPPVPVDKGGLFNSIREKLLQLGQTCVVRVLEGLRLVGLKAGQLVTERTLRQLLKDIVGQHSIRKTLQALAPSGQPVFERISPRCPPRGAAAKRIRRTRQNPAYVSETKSKKTTGRPQTQYRIPTAEALCRWLDVAPSGSDPVAIEDLQSAKKTRQALQLGLIARRPGTYLRKWLADRLGVSERTLSRYNAQTAGLHVVPTYTQTPLGWGNLNAIPRPDIRPDGTCLEDSTGKRWPAIKGVAQKLLAQGRGVRLLVQSLNYYWVGAGDPPADTRFQVQRVVDTAPEKIAAAPVMTLAQQVTRLVRSASSYAPAERSVPPLQNGSERVAHPLKRHSSLSYANRGRRRRPYWKPLADPSLEALVRDTYTQINALTVGAHHKVSLVSVRRWLDRYGEHRLRTVRELLVQRDNIRHPAAFAATVLRTLEHGSS